MKHNNISFSRSLVHMSQVHTHQIYRKPAGAEQDNIEGKGAFTYSSKSRQAENALQDDFEMEGEEYNAQIVDDTDHF